MTNTKTTYIVRSEINPSLILCTDGEFRYEGVIGPGTDIAAKAYKMRRNAEKVRGGYKIIVEEVGLMASLIKCPECGGIVSVRFPIHTCKKKTANGKPRTTKKKSR